MNDVLCFNTRFNNILDCKITTFYENRNRKIEKPIEATDLNYWIKHPFEFSDPILKPEYL